MYFWSWNSERINISWALSCCIIMVIAAKNESHVKVTKKCRCCNFGISKTVESEIANFIWVILLSPQNFWKATKKGAQGRTLSCLGAERLFQLLFKLADRFDASQGEVPTLALVMDVGVHVVLVNSSIHPTMKTGWRETLSSLCYIDLNEDNLIKHVNWRSTSCFISVRSSNHWNVTYISSLVPSSGHAEPCCTVGTVLLIIICVWVTIMSHSPQ